MDAPLTMSQQLDEAESVWQAIQAYLADRKQQVYEEIRDYPTPIAACDQQFNYLLDERMRVTQEVQRWQAAQAAGQQRDQLEAFIQSSSYRDDLIQLLNQSGQTSGTRIMATT